MNGKIEIRAGEFYIQEKVWFQLRQTDEGTEICVSDARVDRRYALCLDEDGCIVRGEVQGFSQKVPEAPVKPIVAPPIINRHTEAYDVNSFHRALEKGRSRPLQRFKTLAKYRFTLRWGKNARPSNKCFPIAGYANDSATYILYRIPSSSKGEGLLRLLPPDLALIDKVDPDRLSRAEWERFLDMPEGEVFRLNNQSWRKLAVEEIRVVVADKVFRHAALKRG